MRRLELTSDVEISTRPLPPPSEAFRMSVVQAARATTGLHELYVLQYSAAALSPSRGLLFAVLVAPGADLQSTAREFHSQIALRFDQTEKFHYTVGSSAMASLIAHCVPDALWHRTYFTERPPARQSVFPVPALPPPPRVMPTLPLAASVAPSPRATPAPRPTPTPTGPPPPPTVVTLADVVSRYALIAWDKQDWLLEVHEGHSVSLELPAGELVFASKGLFGKKHRYRAQVLGAQQPGLWRWSWADRDPSVPERLKASANTVRRRGEREGVTELMTGRLKTGGLVDGETLSAVASGLLDASFYFRVPSDDGAVFVVVSDQAFPRHTEEPAQRALSTLPRAFASVTIPDHRAAIRSYFRMIGLRMNEHAGEIMARSKAGQALRAQFDLDGRLTLIEAI